MNAMIYAMTTNKHTSTAAVVGFLVQVVAIVWPELKPKCDAIFNLAVIYGFARASDAPPPPPGERKRKAPLAALLCGGLAVLWLAAGCASTPPARAFRTLDAIRVTVDRAEQYYGDQCALGRVPENKQTEIDKVITDFHAAFVVAVDVAQFNYENPASAELDRMAVDLVNLIYNIAKEPAP